MKKIIKEKLFDIFCALVCVVIILVIAYNTHYLEGFSLKDFKNLAHKISVDAEKVIKKNTQKRGLKKEYSGFQILKTPVNVINAAAMNTQYRHMFFSNKKSIFYFVDDTNFDNRLKHYLAYDKVGKYYNVLSYNKTTFNNLRAGSYTNTKICNSLEECNKVRELASNYYSMISFLEQCGRTVCIINSSTSQYIRFDNKNYYDVVKVISDFRYW